MNNLSQRLEHIIEISDNGNKVDSVAMAFGGFSYFIHDLVNGLGDDSVIKSVDYLSWIGDNANGTAESWCVVLNLDEDRNVLHNPSEKIRTNLGSAFNLSNLSVSLKIYLSMSSESWGFPSVEDSSFTELYKRLNANRNDFLRHRNLSTEENKEMMVAILVKSGEFFYPLFANNLLKDLLPVNTLNHLNEAYESYTNLNTELIRWDKNKVQELSIGDYNDWGMLSGEKEYDIFVGRKNNIPIGKKIYKDGLVPAHNQMYSSKFLYGVNSSKDYFSFSKYENKDFFWKHIDDISENLKRPNFVFYIEQSLVDKDERTLDARKSYLRKVWVTCRS